MRAWISLCLSGALCSALPASALGAGDPAEKLRTAACGPESPGYECYSKRELWEAARRFEAKLTDERLAHAETKVRLAGAKEKLAVRTSTAVRNLVPPPPASMEVEGHATTTLVLVGVAAAAAGIVVGLLAAPKNPGVAVVK